jgi:hypothetical protein
VPSEDLESNPRELKAITRVRIPMVVPERDDEDESHVDGDNEKVAKVEPEKIEAEIEDKV